MKDRTQYIEGLDINIPYKESSIKELLSFVNASKGDNYGTLLIDSIGVYTSFFALDKVYVLNGTAFKKKNRIAILDIRNIVDVFIDKVGYINLITTKGSFSLGIYKKEVVYDIKDKIVSLIDKNKEDSIKQTKIEYVLKNSSMSKKLSHAKATLEVKMDKWVIKYTFSNHDNRYNYRYLYIEEKDIDRYIKEWQEAFDIYFQNKKKIKANKSFETVTPLGIYVDVNTPHDGVYLHSWQQPFKTRKQLEGIIDDYRNASKIANKLQEEMKCLIKAKYK